MKARRKLCNRVCVTATEVMLVTSISPYCHCGIWLWEGFERILLMLAEFSSFQRNNKAEGSRLGGREVRCDWQSKTPCLLCFICFTFNCSFWMPEIKHSNQCFCSTSIPLPSLNLRLDLGFWVASDFPEWCACSIKYNVLSVSCGNSPFDWKISGQ